MDGHSGSGKSLGSDRQPAAEAAALNRMAKRVNKARIEQGVARVRHGLSVGKLSADLLRQGADSFQPLLTRGRQLAPQCLSHPTTRRRGAGAGQGHRLRAGQVSRWPGEQPGLGWTAHRYTGVPGAGGLARHQQRHRRPLGPVVAGGAHLPHAGRADAL